MGILQRCAACSGHPVEERSMTEPTRPSIAIEAAAVPSRTGALHVPEPFATLLSRRVKHALGDHFGLMALENRTEHAVLVGTPY
jgi:hypothetical protein